MSKIMTTVAALAKAPPPPGAILPDVSKIKIPFEWMAVDYVMSLPSVDFPDTGGLSREYNRQHKRNDWHYDKLRDSIQADGFHDPVFVYPDEQGPELGNGHHRVVAAYDLGYTHLPVTRDGREQWSTSILPREYTY